MVIWWILIPVIYIITARLGFEFASINNNVTLIWPPSGIAVAALLLLGIRFYPAIFLGAFIANLIADMPTAGAAGIAVGNTVSAVAATFLLTRMGLQHTESIKSVQGILILYLIAISTPVIAAVNGALIINLSVVPTPGFINTLRTWWLGDSFGIMMFTPLILAMYLQPYRIERKKITELIYLTFLIVPITFFSLYEVPHGIEGYWHIFSQGEHEHSPVSQPQSRYPLTFIPLAAFVWAGYKFKLSDVAINIIILTFLIIFITKSGHGPFIRENINESLLLISSYITICTIVSYTLSISVFERVQVQRELQASTERFDLVMYGTQDGVWDWNIQTGECYFSANLYKMLGYSHAEFPSHFESWKKRLHPDDKASTLETLFQHINGETPVYEAEYRLCKKDGSFIWIHTRGKGLFGQSRKAYRLVATHINQTKRKEQLTRLELAEKVIRYTPEGIMITDTDLNIVSVNPAFLNISGYSEEEVIGKRPTILNSGRHHKEFYVQMWNEIRGQGYWQGEIWNRRKNGEIYPEWLSISGISDENNKIINYVGIFSDLSHMEHVNKELHNLAYYDPLTGLPNRELFADRLQLALSGARKKDQAIGLLFFDLDRFKNINDTLGHSIGDILLTEAAKKIKRNLPESATVARMGGDEFTIILPDISQPVDAAHIAELILEEFSKHTFTLEGLELYVTGSIGISMFPVDGDTPEHLIKNADTAMYRAKESGRNNFQFFEAEMSERFHERLELEGELRKAIANQQLYIEYQPQVSLSNQKIIGMEALLRWKHPVKGLISPATFIPVAEETGMIVEIGEWVLRNALHDLRQLIDRGHHDLILAVNISSVQIKQAGFLEIVNDALRSSKVSHHNLELEITESLLMENTGSVSLILSNLSKTGINLSIDDFGTGYSSLSYLKRFSIDKLKIDQSFIRDISSDKDDAEIAATIVAMGHNLNLQVIAEGVETQQQVDFLLQKGCDEIQGYLVSPPINLNGIINILEDEKYSCFRLDYCN